MKKCFAVFFFAFTFIFNSLFLKADCEDVKKQANAVNEEVLNIHDENGANIQVNLFNLNENLYVVVLNDFNEEVDTYHFSDLKDGILTFNTKNVNYNIKYVIRVYSEDETCTTEPLKSITFTTAKFNEHSVSTVCNNPYDIEMCSAFYDVGDMTVDEFNKKVMKIIDKESRTFSEKLGDYVSRYYLFVLIPFLVVLCIYIVRIVILKRGKKHE